MKDLDRVRTLLAPYNPVTAVRDPRASASAQRLRAGLLATPAASVAERDVTDSRWERAPRAALAAVVSLAVLFSVVVGFESLPAGLGPFGRTAPASAATPPMLNYTSAGPVGSAREPLLRAAEAAAAQPTPPDARYEFVRTASWNLSTTVLGEDRAYSIVRPEVRESWRADDGSGLVVTRVGEPEFASASGREEWEAAGSPQADEGITSTEFGPDELYSRPTDPLSRDAERLGRQLLAGPAGNNPDVEDDVESLNAVRELLVTQPVDPALRSALWRVLAGLPRLRSFGVVQDRLGRTGVAVGLDSDFSGLPTSYRLIIDPEAGALLAEEQLLTEDAGALDVPIPSVIGYTTLIDSLTVDRKGD